MCVYCEQINNSEKNNRTIADVQFSSCNVEVFIESDKTLCINSYETEYSLEKNVPEICMNVEINYCPMCGRKLNESINESKELEEENLKLKELLKFYLNKECK